jgi:hypothetical protein
VSDLAKALLAFQKDAPPIHFDAKNPHFGNKYASLSGVVAAIRPALNKQGIVFTQHPTTLDDGSPALKTTLIHAESNDTIWATMPLIVSKADAQGYGSALTYARRYALLSVLGLVGDEDDDANAASSSSSAGVARTEEPASPAPRTSTPADSPPGTVIVRFGKHKGKPVTEVPASYWEWWLKQDGNKDPDVLAAVEAHLGMGSIPFDPVPDDLPF